jgi:crotonobetainyl-CoA:carnitine CoA-transferase CaiB-like acyl-CoA transferase
MASLPLRGVRIIDVSIYIAGPLCTRIFADLGAEVIKVEAIQRPEPTRSLVIAENDPQDQPWNRSGYFIRLNMNKYGITLDLTRPQGTDLLKRLVKTADIFIENFNPRVIPSLGLSYEVLKEIKPDIIMASLSGYGQNGPWANWSAFGYCLEYSCGLAYLSGHPGGPPGKQALSFTDPWAGILAAGLLVDALHYRRRTGKGQYIDLSQRDMAAGFLGEALLDYVMNRRVWNRIGNRHPSMAPHGQYRCKGDRQWVALAVTNDDQWLALRKALGDPEWARDPRFATVHGRLANQDYIDEHIQEWTLERDHYTAMHELQASGVPAGPILNAKEVLLEPHLRERRLFQIVDNPRIGRRPYARQTPGWYSAWPEAGTAPKPAPDLGQHNELILGEMLGLGEEELANLAEQGIIGTVPIVAAMSPEQLRSILERRIELSMKLGRIDARETEAEYKHALGID